MLEIVDHKNNGIERKNQYFKYEYLRQYSDNLFSIWYIRDVYNMYMVNTRYVGVAFLKSVRAITDVIICLSSKAGMILLVQNSVLFI